MELGKHLVPGGGGVLLIWIIVVQGPVALAIVRAGVVWTFFLSSIILSSFSFSLGDGPI